MLKYKQTRDLGKITGKTSEHGSLLRWIVYKIYVTFYNRPITLIR